MLYELFEPQGLALKLMEIRNFAQNIRYAPFSIPHRHSSLCF